jgi:hypothetical protein
MSSIIFGSFTPAAAEAAAITNSLAETAVTKYSDPFAFAEEEKIKIADGSDRTQVWEVKATLDSKDFALKNIPDEKRAMTEFAAYRRLEDQNIIRCYSCTKVDNGYQLLLERGECTLLELIKVCNGGLPTHENPNREKFLTWAKQYVTLWEDFYRPTGDKLARPGRTPSTTLVSLLRLPSNFGLFIIPLWSSKSLEMKLLFLFSLCVLNFCVSIGTLPWSFVEMLDATILFC